MTNNNLTLYGNSLFLFAKGPCCSRAPAATPAYYWAPTYNELDFNYFNFKNSTLEFDMKINNVGNHLNANIYLIAPIKDYNKQNGSNFFCNVSGGDTTINSTPNYCTEIDIIECNFIWSYFYTSYMY